MVRGSSCKELSRDVTRTFGSRDEGCRGDDEVRHEGGDCRRVVGVNQYRQVAHEEYLP